MNTLDIEIPPSPSNLMNSHLHYFLQYLEVASNNPEASASANSATCIFHITRFGRKSKLTVIHTLAGVLTETEINGYFYFKAHSVEVIGQLSIQMKCDLHFRIYLLCHNLFDLVTEYKKLVDAGIDLSRITFILSKSM